MHVNGTKEKIDQLLSDPSASNWLKDSLKVALSRDPVDAANDAEVLLEILSKRASQISHSQAPALEWKDYLKLTLQKYESQPDDFKLSLGHWVPEEFGVPTFNSSFCMTLGELRNLTT
jgi:hypothetical protein